jgi:hypothetical protein
MQNIDYFELIESVKAFCDCFVAAERNDNDSTMGIRYGVGLYLTDTVTLVILKFEYLTIDLLEVSQEIIKMINPELKISLEFAVQLSDGSTVNGTGFRVTSEFIEDKRAARLRQEPFVELSSPKRLPETLVARCKDYALSKVSRGPYRRYLEFRESDFAEELKRRLVDALAVEGLCRDVDFDVDAETDGGHYAYVYLRDRAQISLSLIKRIRLVSEKVQPWTIVFYVASKDTEREVEVFTAYGPSIEAANDPEVAKLVQRIGRVS